jgi:hypothetical protein
MVEFEAKTIFTSPYTINEKFFKRTITYAQVLKKSTNSLLGKENSFQREKAMIFSMNNKKFLHLLHKTMHLYNHNDNTCDNLLHFTSYKFCNGITMHEHKMNMEIKIYHKLNIQWTWRLPQWRSPPFGLCIKTTTNDLNIFPNVTTS